MQSGTDEGTFTAETRRGNMQAKSQGRLKKVFPGANTPRGFVSFYSYLMEPCTNMVFIIKGGPGIGKSTLIDRIGRVLLNMGYDTEYACCAHDPSSYDGIVVPELGLGLFDGTPPHVLEPRLPGIVERIINLGDFLLRTKLIRHKQEVVQAQEEVSTLFDIAFRYLEEARLIYDHWEACNAEALDPGRLNCIVEELLSECLHGTEVSVNPGKPRCFFASAITANGPIHHLETVVSHASRRYILQGEPGTGKSAIVKEIADKAISHGFNVELYHCPINPKKVQHAVVPGLGVALISSEWPHLIAPMEDIDRVIEAGQILSTKIAGKYRFFVSDAKQRFQDVLEKAVKCFHQAKQEYDKVQAIYSESMDFSQVERLGDGILGEILELAEEIKEATP